MLNLNDERIRAHLKIWTTNDISGHGCPYSATIETKQRTIQPQSICPKQFTLENLVSMTTITANVGKGWDAPNASNNFSADNDDTNDPMENLMTTSHSFEEAHILYFTMKCIKVTMNEKTKGFASLNVSCQIMSIKI